MEFLSNRFYRNQQVTISQLYAGEKGMGFILEDPVREVWDNEKWVWKPEFKIPGVTAIPSGRYELIITESPRFRRKLPLLVDVPDYTGVRIHKGNRPEDSEGCLLPGENWDIKNPNWVSRSAIIYNDIMRTLDEALKSEKCYITMRNDFDERDFY